MGETYALACLEQCKYQNVTKTVSAVRKKGNEHPKLVARKTQNVESYVMKEIYLHTFRRRDAPSDRDQGWHPHSYVIHIVYVIHIFYVNIVSYFVVHDFLCW